MQNQHRINYQTMYFGKHVLYVVESFGSIAYNVKRLCDVWLMRKVFSATILQNPCYMPFLFTN